MAGRPKAKGRARKRVKESSLPAIPAGPKVEAGLGEQVKEAVDAVLNRNPYDQSQKKAGVGPWNRLPGEPSGAFRAFEIYRRLGPNRTLLKVKHIMAAHRGEVQKALGERGLAPRQLSQIHPVYQQRARDAAGEELLEAKSTIVDNGGVGEDGECSFPSDAPSDPRDRARERKNQLNPGGYYYSLSVKWNWVERARAWDEAVQETERQAEIDARRAESLHMAHVKRAMRDRMVRIALGLLERIARMLESDAEYDPKSLRELTLAAERAGVVRDNAFSGVRDLLDDGNGDAGKMPAQLAARLAAVLVEATEAGQGMPALELTGVTAAIEAPIDVACEPAPSLGSE